MSVANKPWGLMLLSVLCVGIGLGPQAIFMVCNFTQGLTWGQDDTSRYVFAFGALFFDAGFVLASVMRGHFLRIGERWKALTCIGPICFCGGMSLFMFYQFAASNQIEPARRAELEQAAAVNAVQQSTAMTAANKAQLSAFLQKEITRLADEARKKNLTSEQRASIQADQKTYLDKMEQAASVEVKAVPVDKSTTSSALLARSFGFEGGYFQKIYLLVFGIGMLWVSSFMIRKGVTLWPVKAEAQKSMPPAPANDHTSTADLDTVMSSHEQVRRFFKKNTRSDPEAEVGATDMHRAYVEWATNLRFHPILTSQGFGAAVTTLRANGEVELERYLRGGSVNYKGKIPFNLKKPPRRVPRVRETPVAPIRLASTGIVH